MFLLRIGQARYYKLTKAGSEILLQWLLPGDVFGLGTLLENPPNYIGSGEALSDCELLAWEHTSMRKLAKTYPQLAENGLRIVLRYLKGYADRQVGLVAKSAQQRLAGTLLNLGHRTGRVHPHGVEIEATNDHNLRNKLVILTLHRKAFLDFSQVLPACAFRFCKTTARLLVSLTAVT